MQIALGTLGVNIWMNGGIEIRFWILNYNHFHSLSKYLNYNSTCRIEPHGVTFLVVMLIVCDFVLNCLKSLPRTRLEVLLNFVQLSNGRI
jgi:hypothetical protein